MSEYNRLALVVSDAPRAQEAAEREFRSVTDWVPLEEADAVVVLGGDGFMLQTLHAMLDTGRIIPAYGLNLGTVGFLMNRNRNPETLIKRIGKAKPHHIAPLRMQAETQDGAVHTFCAINEVSLLRETRQTAKLEVTVDDKVRIAEGPMADSVGIFHAQSADQRVFILLDLLGRQVQVRVHARALSPED